MRSLTLFAALALSPPSPAQSFVDVSASAGFNALHLADKPATGIAVADFDRNGWPDLFVTGYFQDSRLLLNRGDGTFSDFPSPAAVALPNGRCGSVAAADYDNDGWPDLYVACFGSNHLLRNLGGSGFADLTAAAGVDHPGRSEAVAWADIDADGWLDLFVGVHPLSADADPNDPLNQDQIFLSNRDGSFRSISHLLNPVELAKLTLAAIFTDVDLDGDVDLYVVNDKLYGNTLWRNDGPGCGDWCLTDISAATASNRPAYSMGITVADYDRDGDWDLVYSSIHEQVLLQGQQAQGSMQFVEQSVAAGISVDAIGWGVNFFDTDNDAWEDLFIPTTGSAVGTTDHLLRNQGDATFADVSLAAGLAIAQPTEASAWLDYDRDGRLDLALGYHNIGYALHHNVSTANVHAAGNSPPQHERQRALAPNSSPARPEPRGGGKAGSAYRSNLDGFHANHWIGLQLEGGGSINRDAIGSLVRVTASDGSVQMRERRAGESRGSSNDPILHFGLGGSTSAAVSIRWPDGYLTYNSLARLPSIATIPCNTVAPACCSRKALNNRGIRAVDGWLTGRQGVVQK